MDEFDPRGELRDLLARDARSVVVVVGAGVTIGALRGSPLAGLATWQGLLLSGLEHVRGLRLRGEAELAEIRRRLEGADPREWITAAEQITDALGGPSGGEMLAWLQRTVGAFPQHIRDRSVLDALGALHARGAILATVNYDGVLEAATGLRPVTWREKARVERVIRGDEPGILHLHGYWEDPPSVVFGTSSYEQVAGDRHARAVLEALRMTRTLLFVGHGAGLQDPNWGSFLGWMEQVFAGSGYRHYRLTLARERARAQAEHRQAQRITAIEYGREHADLGPFLRSLVPAETSTPTAKDERAEQPVILLINVVDKDHTRLTKDAVLRELGVSEAVCVEVAAEINRFSISARQWRSLARRVDEAVKDACAVEGRVRYVIAGQAPLPVFAYLGQKMRRAQGRKCVLNVQQATGKWDRVGPLEEIKEAGRDFFTRKPPKIGRERRGRIALSVQCSREYGFEDSWVEPMIEAEGGTLLGSYRIHNEEHLHHEVPLEARELPVLLRHVGDALTWVAKQGLQLEGVVAAIGGPSWAAFWIGHHLNPNVCGPRIDFPNFVPGQGYVRALSSPMHKAPWLGGRAKLMFMGAEPDDSSRVGGARAFRAIQQAMEREFQRSDTYELRVVGATTVKEFGREVELFKPDILHLHLHGMEDRQGGLIFETENGERKPVPPEAVVGMLRASGCRPALVVLSACHSAALAPLLGEIAECVVYMTGEVDYRVAIDFARLLYGALARGRTLAGAIEHARSAIHGEWGKAENEKIDWLCAPGVELGEVILLHGRAR